MEEKKLSYEELQNALHAVSDENAQMREYIKRQKEYIDNLNLTNVFKRLDYLFEILKAKECFDAQFIADCVEEIKEAIVAKEKPEDGEA